MPEEKKELIAKKGDTVKINYVGKLEDGTIFDESKLHDGPLEFKVGDKKLLPEFENAVVGMTVGQTKTITIKSDDAYGARKEELVQKVNRNQLPADMEPKIGQQLRAKRDDDNEIIVTVVGIDETEITIDVTHPLAGKDLAFDIELLEIKEAE